jgi:predicted negative regulator of RcsB-dependent stress response
LEVYRTDEEQIEHLKKWWRDNGKSIVGGIVIGLAAVFGWREWQDYLTVQAEMASGIYQDMIVNVRQNKNDNAREYAGELIDDYPSTTYAIFASLMLAKLDSDKNALGSAIEHLQWVLDNTAEEQFLHLARLRISRLLLAENKPDETLELLESAEPGKFLASYEELKGDSYIQLGRIKEAKDAYELALAVRGTANDGQSVLQMKLNDLGRLNP